MRKHSGLALLGFSIATAAIAADGAKAPGVSVNPNEAACLKVPAADMEQFVVLWNVSGKRTKVFVPGRAADRVLMQRSGISRAKALVSPLERSGVISIRVSKS